MISENDLIRIEKLREKVFDHIKKSLEECGHCKSYEGAVRIVYPTYFTRGDPDCWGLELHCYLIGPSRHYEWRGNILAVCIDKAEKDINHWTSQEYQA
jgi:hypothetical protein